MKIHSRLVPAAALAAAATAALALIGALPAAAQPAHHTHVLHIQGVSIRVPASWHVVKDAYLPGCIVDPGAPKVSAHDADYDVNNCQLQILASGTLPRSAAVPDSIRLAQGPGDPAECLPGKHATRAVGFTTVAARHARVGSAPAEYARFTLPCLEHPLEAWFVGRQPGVLISRSRMLPSTEAAADRAVASATVPRGHGLPRGFIGEPVGAGRSTVLLNPTHVYYSGRDAASAARSGAEHRLFHVPSGIKIHYFDVDGDGHTLNRATFLHDVKRGFPNSGGLHPEVTVTSGVGSSVVGGIVVQLASRH